MAKKHKRKLRKSSEPKSAVKPKAKAKSNTQPTAPKPQRQAAPAATAVPEVSRVEVARYAYVGVEVRKILYLTAVFVLVQIALWFALRLTGLGDKLAALIKI